MRGGSATCKARSRKINCVLWVAALHGLTASPNNGPVVAMSAIGATENASCTWGGVCRGLLALIAFMASCAQAENTAKSDAAPSDDIVPADAASTPIVDAAVSSPLTDAATATAIYLDRCTSPDDCVSGLCEVDIGGSLFCSRSCTSNAQCAYEHVCADSVCQPDDTGAPCSVATPETCELGLCLGSGDGTGACTRTCNSANDCPAGYACTQAGGSSEKLCVNIEKACADGNNCGSGLCLSAQGCTAFCDSAADCPQTLGAFGIEPYTCEVAFGSGTPICVPPLQVLGPDPIGATCNATGTVTCRSGACNGDAPIAPMCTQTCSPQGGCGPGLGCFPLADLGTFHLVCNRAGAGDLGDVCNQASDCTSGLCSADQSPAYCTRHCNDGLCPTGWTCVPVAGSSIAMCRQ